MMEDLIENLINLGYLKTDRIIKAFQNVDRADFVPVALKADAYLNVPLPIGYGQTISQPLTVAFMLEQLQPKEGDKILDIGSGSGWQTALLADMVGPKGKIFALERISELKAVGERNLKKYHPERVKFICADGSKGYPNIATRPELAEGFDKIIAAASAEKLPTVWQEQLRVGGRLVVPIQESIWLLIKKSKTKFEQKEFPGFVFVPLIKE